MGKRRQSLTDEQLLAVVRARAAGQDLTSLAKVMGVTEIFLRVATNRVKNADLGTERGARRSSAARCFWPNVWCANG